MRLVFQRGSLLYKRLFLTVSSSIAVSTKHFSYLGNWNSPQGYDSGIMVYNSAINEKVSLVLKNKGTVTWYICGPTVYDESHIGHACCYVKFDIIKRVLEKVFNINVLLLMGITDIDDKIIKKSIEAGLSASEIAKHYEFGFFKDMEAMRVKRPIAISRVTENIPLIIEFCTKLIEKDFAYVTDEGNVYFIVSKSTSANLFNEMPNDFQVVVDPLKRDQRDFALWKKAKPEEPFWESPWGKGRPGWHIECSAIASNIFGCQIDIHSGGYDLLFPHHTNEKSQSEAFHGCSQWVNYWLHSGLLHVGNEEKMSKSIKNTISINEYLRTNSVNDFRIMCLQSLYRRNISYCNETIEGARGLHEKLHNFVNECDLYIYNKLRISTELEKSLFLKLEETKEKIVSHLSDDFNTSQALLCLNDLVDVVNKALQSANDSSLSDMQGVTSVAACLNYVEHALDIFGVKIMCKKRLRQEFVCFIDSVVKFRNAVRLFSLCRSEKEIVSPTQFLEEAYANVESALSHISKLENSIQDIHSIKYATNLMFQESLKFISTLPENNISINNKEILKAEKIRRAFLLTLCDDLRSSLQLCGIAIKDRKDISTWFPLISLKI
ncbi:probable cysteine--tRNA ligase, mitochondrial isoform X2 [Parasteatoda tepidariorum]|nr:probable cysteine--tRNA ligase, mitochondrial [Parasteatoda tepidariorum]XP_015920446.1 probable cysteine--tRNA ligase, mitochondrial [Parasteatoda tepidariorum]